MNHLEIIRDDLMRNVYRWSSVNSCILPHFLIYFSLSLRGWPIELHQTQWEINETEHVPFFRFGTCSLLLYLYLPREVGLLMFGSPYTCFQSWKGSFIQLSWHITWNKCWGCCFIRIFSKNVYTPCIIAFRI